MGRNETREVTHRPMLEVHKNVLQSSPPTRFVEPSLCRIGTDLSKVESAVHVVRQSRHHLTRRLASWGDSSTRPRHIIGALVGIHQSCEVNFSSLSALLSAQILLSGATFPTPLYWCSLKWGDWNCRCQWMMWASAAARRTFLWGHQWGSLWGPTEEISTHEGGRKKQVQPSAGSNY